MEMTVIIPTYNRKNVLRHVILSLINQGVSSYELVICDDGSDDGTDDMVTSLQDQFKLPFEIRHFWQEKKGFRPAAARNMGIDNARGKKIVFVDQDVIVEPNTLKKFINVPANHFWSGSKRLVSIEFYTEKVNDDVILNNFSEVFRSQVFGTIPATLSSFGVINKVDIDRVGGFDEDFTDWGLEDTELIDRLHDIRVSNSVEPTCFSFHIEHDGHGGLSRKIQDTYHHKRNNRRGDGQIVH